MSRAQEILNESVKQCSGDVSDCEVMRLSIFLKDASLENAQAQELRGALADLACKDCKTAYLTDFT